VSSSRRGTRNCRAILLTAAAVMAAAPLGAQVRAAVVTGEIVAPESSRSLEGAMMTLLDSSDVRRSAAFSSAGYFTLVAPAAGTYRVRAEIVGRVTVTSDPFLLAKGDSIHQKITGGARLAVLSTVKVIERSPCTTARMQTGNETIRLWEETTKALRAASFAEESQMMTFEVLVWYREQELQHRISYRTNYDTQKVTKTRPSSSRTPAQLAKDGYAKVSRREIIYYAPDHSSLLSNEFLTQHCFWTTPYEISPESGLIGLAFEPVLGRKRPEVRGTFWIDSTTSELRRLEYQYTGVPTADVIKDGGGQLEFQHLPSGAWIVSRWVIRMPVIEMVAPAKGQPKVPVPVVINEAGGRVLEIVPKKK